MSKKLMNVKVLTFLVGLAAVLTLVAVINHGSAPEPVQAAAAVDYYLKIGDIKGESIIQGESTDRGHEGDIDVLSWSWC